MITSHNSATRARTRGAGLLVAFSLAALQAGCATARSIERENAAGVALPPRDDRAPSLDALVPESARAANEALSRAETAASLSRAAEAYAQTDAAGMAVLWALHCGAATGLDRGCDGAAHALVRVFRERVLVSQQRSQRDVVVRLAPGAMPVWAREQQVVAPALHLFEARVVLALAEYDGTVEPAALARALEAYVNLGSQTVGPLYQAPAPLGALHRAFDHESALNRWLGAIAAAGHLEAFVYALLRAPFAEQAQRYERTHAAAVGAMRAWVRAHRLEAGRAPAATDLVRVSRGALEREDGLALAVSARRRAP